MSNLFLNPILAQVIGAPPAAAAGQPSSTANLLPAAGEPTLSTEMNEYEPADWGMANGYSNYPKDAYFNVGWQADNISFNNGIMTLQLDDEGCPSGCSGMPYASAEYRSDDRYGHGLLQGRIRAASGDGLNTSLFFYTGSPHDEIDIEILGKDPTRMQVNYHTNGVEHKTMIDLGFDASQGFHDYAILWTPNYISWYVDGRLVWTEDGSRGDLPTHEGQIMMNLWSGTSEAAWWLHPFTYPGQPVQAQYDSVRFTPISRIPDLPAQAPLAPAQILTHSMPPGFTDANLDPEEMMDGNRGTIGGSQTREREYKEDIGMEEGFWEEGAPYRIRNDFKRIFRERIIQWMLLRDNGDPNADEILDKMPQACIGNSYPYWKAKVAHLIVSGNPNEIQIKFLKRLGFITAADNFSVPLSKAERFTILERIYNFYKGKSAEKDLLGQMQLQLSYLAPTEAVGDVYRAGAMEMFDAIINSHLSHLDNPHQDPTWKSINSRMSYLSGPQSQNNIDREYRMVVGEALRSKAQILLHRAGETTDPTEAMGNLLEAFHLLRADEHGVIPQQIPLLDGFHYQELKRLAAECLIRIGFVVKDFEENLSLAQIEGFNDLLGELKTWETEKENFSAPAAENYELFFRAADVLIEGFSEDEDTAGNGVPRQSVFDWQKEYVDQLRDNGVENSAPCLWSVQMIAFARVWLASMEMVRIGEDRAGAPKDYKKDQKDRLAAVEADLRQILTNAAGGVLDEEVVASVNRTLAENLARQGFLAMDLGQPYQSFFDDAKEILEGIIGPNSLAKPEVKAEARLWLAKVMLVGAGLQETTEKKEKILNEGVAHVVASLAQDSEGYLLKWVTLSSAFQTYGDLLSAQKEFDLAADQYRLALGENIENENDPIRKLFQKNYYARVSMGDLYNWQSDYVHAEEQYGMVPEDSDGNNIDDYPEYRFAQLGLAEVRMRRDENYLPEDIQHLEDAVFPWFAAEAPGSFVLQRALEDLIEAYGTDDDLQGKIILIGNRLLGANYSLDQTFETLGAVLDNHLALRPKFVGLLYLRLAEALMWRKRFDEAESVVSGIPAEPMKFIEGNEELRLLYHLIKAENDSLRGKEAAPILNERVAGQGLIDAIYESGDPDLYTRVIRSLIDGYNSERNYVEAANTAKRYLAEGEIEKIKVMFTDKNRGLSFVKFRFRLWRKLTQALIWNEGKKTSNRDYRPAIESANNMLSEIEARRGEYPALSNFFDLMRAQTLLDLGDVHRYDWSDRNYGTAFSNYNEALEILSGLPRKKEVKVALAWVYYGLGEIYNYAQGYENYQDSLDHYKLAEEIALALSVYSTERPELLARIYLGMAKLELSNGAALAENYNRAYDDIRNAEDNFENIYNPDPKLEDDIDAAYSDILPHVMPSVDTTMSVTRGSNGLTETQLLVQGDIPLGLGDVYSPLNCLHLLIRGQLDHSSISDLYTGYLGLKFYPHSALSLTLDLRMGTFGGRESTIFYRRPDLNFSAFYWNRYFTLGYSMGLANVYDSEPGYAFTAPMTTYHLEGMFNFDGVTDNEWLDNLRIGAQFNHFNYFYLGGARERDQFSFGVQYDTGDAIANWFKLKTSAFALLYPDEQGTVGGGFEGTLGAEASFLRYLRLDALYKFQVTNNLMLNSDPYMMHTFNLLFGVTF